MNSTSVYISCELLKNTTEGRGDHMGYTVSLPCIDEDNNVRQITCESEFLVGSRCRYDGELSVIAILLIIFAVFVVGGLIILLVIIAIKRKRSNKNENNNNIISGSNEKDDNGLPEYTAVNINSISNENNTTTQLPSYKELMVTNAKN